MDEEQIINFDVGPQIFSLQALTCYSNWQLRFHLGADLTF